MFKHRRKLSLTKDTLRALETDELKTVVGGLAATVTSQQTRPPITLQASVCRCNVLGFWANTC